MKKLVSSSQDLCLGCNRCTRACPIETANLTYQDDDGNIKVKIDSTKCIACGNCITVCKHDARYYSDDIQSFFDDLEAGKSISVVIAPAMKSNFSNWKQMLTFLKKKGVNKI